MTEPGTYLTIAAPSEGTYKEKGSRFLAFAFPVPDEAAIKEILDQLKRKYFDARHHCYAFILGPAGRQYRANDGGEPNHSAGDPILGQIRSRRLTNVLVVVVRYFGGTKLGMSGLIQAYRTAASEALQAATLMERVIYTGLILTFSYEALNTVMKVVKDYELPISRQDFTDGCRLQIEVPRGDAERVAGLLEAAGIQVQQADANR